MHNCISQNAWITAYHVRRYNEAVSPHNALQLTAPLTRCHEHNSHHFLTMWEQCHGANAFNIPNACPPLRDYACPLSKGLFWSLLSLDGIIPCIGCWAFTTASDIISFVLGAMLLIWEITVSGPNNNLPLCYSYRNAEHIFSRKLPPTARKYLQYNYYN